MIGKQMLAMFPSHIDNGLFAMYCGVVETGEPTLTEVWFDEGPIRGWFEVRTSKLGDGWIATARDVSVRRATEDRLREREALLQATVESFLNPHVLLNAVRDQSGVIVDFVYADANEKACAYNGIPRAQLIGARLLDLLPGHVGTGLLAMYANTVETGEPLDLTDFAYQQELLDEDRRYDILAVKVGDGLSFTWRDVTDRYHAAEALRLSEDRYRMLAEHSSDVVFMIDTDNVYRWVSPSAATVLGWKSEDLIGKSSVDFVPAEDHARLVAARRTPSAGIASVGDFRYRRADGSYVWVSGRSTELTVDGVATGRVVALREVQAQHDEVARRAAAESQYRLLAENASDVVFMVDNDGVYRWVSPSITAELGWRPDQVIGTSGADLVHADDLPRVIAARQRATGDVAKVDEFRCRCADGTYVWVTGRSANVVVDGVATGRVVALRSVHALHLEHERLMVSEQQYRLLAENGNDVVVLSVPGGGVVWVSPSVNKVLGWTTADLIGVTVLDLVHPEDRVTTEPTLDRLFAAEPAALNYTVRMRTASGDYRWMRGPSTPVLDEHGNVAFVVTGLQDVTDEIEVARARDRSEAMVRSVLDASADQVLQYDRECRVEYVNAQVVRFSGIPYEAWIGRTPEELGFPDDECAPLREHVRRVFDERAGHRFERLHQHSDGLRYFEVSLSPIFDETNDVMRVMADSRDVTDRHHLEHELADRATHDRLTGLANREVLIAEIDRARAASRRSNRRIGLLMIDLDHFKNINDSLGHDTGDRLLVAAAERFTSVVRAGDLIARLGGDEFVVVLRDLEHVDDALLQAHRIVGAFRSPLYVEGGAHYATTSIGVTVSTVDTTANGDLLREADTALYEAKEAGRDRAAVFNPGLRAAASERLRLETELRPALERGQFAVWYQPQVDMSTGEVVAVEALLRWHHPSGEVLNANRFIDAAEEAGLLSDIGDWALLQACTQMARWNAEPGGSQLTVGVNISARQLAETDLHRRTAAILEASGLDPTLLCIEITETTMLVQTAESRQNLQRLHEAGIRLAIDDFGTGYASLAYLREIHVDTVKIDRSFVNDLNNNDFDRRLVDGIIALANRLGISVTAEGVETDDQANTLLQFGCDRAQGFLYSPAIPADEFARRYLTSAKGTLVTTTG
ncbi:MAG: EAL domain-containing protein [Ilumatobacteraceae bacterium]